MRVLIVGSGVAGISLAQALLQEKVEVHILDKGQNVSSAVAAGLINPLVFRRMTLSWRVHDLLPFAIQFYRDLEQLSNTSFLHPVTIRRLFASEQERDFWIKKQELPEFAPFMETLSEADEHYNSPQNTFGTARVNQAHFVDTTTFLEAGKSYLNSCLKTAEFDFDALDPVTGQYEQEVYDYIVFAEGKDGKYNPYFSYLPLQQTKGEVLTLQSNDIPEGESLNRKCFLLPIGNHEFKVGSTYVWDTDNTEITAEGRAKIEENLASVTSESYSVIGQRAGIRPTVPDRRPMIGKHPEFPKLVFANGLGTKGYMLGPKIMQELAQHLVHELPLHPECDLQRFTVNPHA